MADVDLRQLAVDRNPPARKAARDWRRVTARYVLPSLLILGFAALVGWSARNVLFPPRSVSVVPVLATTAAVEPAGTTLFQAAGWIEPRPTPIRVAALAPGVVESLLVVEDQYVSVGEPIAELIKRDAELEIARAEANLSLRKAELDEAEAAHQAAKIRFEQPVHLKAAVSEAQSLLAKTETELQNLPFQIRRAEADLKALRQEYESKLAAKGAVAGVEITSALGKADAAEALVEELRQRAGALKRERDAAIRRRDALSQQLSLLIDETREKSETQARVEAAKARLRQAQVALDQAHLQSERMTVVAPLEGRIFRLIAQPGARVGGNQAHASGYDGSTIVTMYQPDRLQVRVDVRFEDLPSISLDQPVQINNPAIASPLIGSVLFISSEADIQKNTLQVKVAIADPPDVFKPDMLVDVTFLAPDRPGKTSAEGENLVLHLPQQVIHRGTTGPFVWLADQSQGIARRQSVELGSVSGNGLVEVISGLNLSSRVISSETEQLTDGDRITIAGEDRSIVTEPTAGDSSNAAPAT